MTRPKAWLVAGSLLLAAGCARGDTSSTTSATSEPLIGATTGASTTRAPSTTAPPARPRGTVDEPTLKQALLALSDLAPGFAEEPASSGKKGVCGRPPVSEQVPIATEAGVTFSKGSVGPVVAQRIGSFQDVKTAQKYLDTFRSDATCTTYKDGTDEVTLAALNVGSHGDDTLAYRSSISSGGTFDYAFMRFGSVIVQVAAGGLVTDNDLMLAAVSKAAQKAATIR